MRTLILLAIVVAVLQFGLKYYITPPYGPDVVARFIERSKVIPSFGLKDLPPSETAFNAANFARWLAMPANDAARKGYLSPVILPLDILFLIALGCLLGWTSSLLANNIGLVAGLNPMVWWLFPVVYIVCDFVEDIFIVGILTQPRLLGSTTFCILRSATTGKLWSVTISFIQTGLLAVGWLVTVVISHLK